MTTSVSDTSLSEWQARVGQLEFERDAFIDGGFVPSNSGRRFASSNPATGEVLVEVARCDGEDVDAAVAAARRAFQQGDWSQASPARRRDVLLKIADMLQAEADAFALTETLDVGKPIRDSLTVDVPAAERCLRWYAEAIDKVYGEVAPTATGTLATVRRVPVGVVAAVVPWNFPLVMAMTKLAPALAAGNSVVIKPAEQSPLSLLRFARLAQRAGLPKGVLNVVPGFGEEAGQALGLHPDVQALSFTGSTAVGKAFLRYAGDSNMKKVSLECGGKSANIVLDDCPDIDAAARASAAAIFFNQGEICNAGSRLIVQSGIRERFLEALLEAARDFAPGNPLDPDTRMGALISPEHCRTVSGYVDRARHQGARVLIGGEPLTGLTAETFYPPTVLDEVSNRMEIASEEIFGPVLCVLTVETAEEAVQLANDSRYGLAAAVWTRDLSTAFRMEQALEAGTVWINAIRAGDMSVPFGGMKESGLGRDKSLHAFDNVTHLKSTWVAL
ncbi:aldehyde dehydrogenase family protein [Billgrantia kenyensis]|uniref:Aldehyde dehydrogenase family protein n=1 Tax=Billgrantia kenyensis TaxID=321266 RepID=A0A7V9W2Y6_9GAMM|nr:aldehyde dehydrogenase family protein [Halomonas kenyensis]MBA2780088.1 aldehyde dehydrogenase family protein [Halomonas kenyensis]MCG6661961.1 aldehyde dehydrogenase family protein [Halomonas kenyensis]